MRWGTAFRGISWLAARGGRSISSLIAFDGVGSLPYEFADPPAGLHPLCQRLISGFLVCDEVRQQAAVQLDVVLRPPRLLQPCDEPDDLVARAFVGRFVQKPLFGGKLARARLEH